MDNPDAAIAERAGVSRPTVYNQFPDDRSLLAACSGLFTERNPFPPLAGLELGEALHALYRYYRANERMLANVQRDALLLPAVAEAVEGFRRPVSAAVEEQAERTCGGSAEARAVLLLCFGLSTWQTLAGAGPDDAEAARVMARLVACAAPG